MQGLTNAQQSTLMFVATILVAIGSIQTGIEYSSDGHLTGYGIVIIVIGAVGVAIKEKAGSPVTNPISAINENLIAKREEIHTKTAELNKGIEDIQTLTEAHTPLDVKDKE